MSSSTPFYPFHYKTIDYAGLFPPASLSLDKAIENYAKYRLEPESWMLSRFVIPSTKLNDLHPFKHLFSSNPPFQFSILGGAKDSTTEFKRNLDAVITDIKTFETAIGKDIISIEALELKVPVLQDILFVLNIISDAISKYDTEVPLEIYLEFNLSQKHNDDLKLILRDIKDLNFNNKNKK